MRAWLLPLLLLAVVGNSARAAPKKKKAPKPPSPSALATQAAIKQALDSAQAAVGACVVEGAGSGTWTQIVVVGVSINSVGQVLALDVKLKPENEKAATTKACVEKALEAVSFPKSEAPLVQAEREWTFSMQ